MIFYFREKRDGKWSEKRKVLYEENRICLYLTACVCVSVLLTRQYDRERFEKTDIEREEMNMESGTTEMISDDDVAYQDMLHKLDSHDSQNMNGNNVIDLGNHVVAYRISADEEILSRLGGLEKFSGSDYIAICPIPYNKIGRTDTCIQYLQDVYGNIMEMRVEDSGELYIRYADAGSDQEKEVWIPVYLPSQEENMIDITDYEHMLLGRRIASGQEYVFSL